MELLDFVAAKFHEEGGVFKLLVSIGMNNRSNFLTYSLCYLGCYPPTHPVFSHSP